MTEEETGRIRTLRAAGNPAQGHRLLEESASSARPPPKSAAPHSKASASRCSLEKGTIHPSPWHTWTELCSAPLVVLEMRQRRKRYD
ncbi:hypothetical protein CapIbe_008675 [Capra ibex]